MIVVTLSVVAIAASHGSAVPILSRDLAGDQRYMRHMVAHHEQGVELARIGQQRAQDPHLRTLAASMVASQTGENRIFEQWWRGWFSEPMSVCSSEERTAMPGYLTPAQMAEVRKAADGEFDAVFIRLMSLHHAGAVQMADTQWRSSGDLRLRLMVHAIRHEQQGEIALMNKATGIEAVRQATRNMLANNL